MHHNSRKVWTGASARDYLVDIQSRTLEHERDSSSYTKIEVEGSHAVGYTSSMDLSTAPTWPY